MSYTISEVAARVGITPSTLRFYDQEGLLPNIKRKNGIRVFEDVDIRFLGLLNCLKNTGMPIKRIKQYVDLTKEGDATLAERYELIREQRQFVQAQIDNLLFYMQELDFKDWFYNKALTEGTTANIDVDDYERETGQKMPEMITKD